ncbi:MAG: BlaI/MecI/CopY family transcriptional regulator [Planctomycetes bacterium]|nr:BlaI/MecI/CopY family transcriptional regulator [Planctomycetota bacterium]
MPKRPAEVTDTELAILDVLWERGPSQIRDIVEALYTQHTPALHATVKSLLERLTDKGFVECDRSRFAHRFSALITREGYVGHQLQKLADSHFDGSLAPMLLTLIDRVKLSRKEREAIRKILEGMG